MLDLLEAPAPPIEDPAFCRCGTKRSLRKGGAYLCPNCDAIPPLEAATGKRVRTPADVRFDATYKGLVESWYEEGFGADPIFRVKDGKPETFEDLYTMEPTA
jgi:hypothetical protein